MTWAFTDLGWRYTRPSSRVRSIGGLKIAHKQTELMRSVLPRVLSLSLDLEKISGGSEYVSDSVGKIPSEVIRKALRPIPLQTFQLKVAWHKESQSEQRTRIYLPDSFTRSTYPVTSLPISLSSLPLNLSMAS